MAKAEPEIESERRARLAPGGQMEPRVNAAERDLREAESALAARDGRRIDAVHEGQREKAHEPERPKRLCGVSRSSPSRTNVDHRRGDDRRPAGD